MCLERADESRCSSDKCGSGSNIVSPFGYFADFFQLIQLILLHSHKSLVRLGCTFAYRLRLTFTCCLYCYFLSFLLSCTTSRFSPNCAFVMSLNRVCLDSLLTAFNMFNRKKLFLINGTQFKRSCESHPVDRLWLSSRGVKSNERCRGDHCGSEGSFHVLVELWV